MNRATSKRMTSGTDQEDLTTGNACWETPPLVFKKLNEDFGPFDLDLTADAQRHLCARWFGPESSCGESDALSAPWHDFGTNGYSNPPYGPFIQPLLYLAKSQALRHGFTTTLLLPLRVTKAFKAHVLRIGSVLGASDLLFCDSRITFFEDGVPRLNEKRWREDGKAIADPAMFDSIVVCYRPGAITFNVDTWHVPTHVTGADLLRAVQRRQAPIDAVEDLFHATG